MGCPECNNTGWIEEDSVKVECPCVLKERMLTYLTPVYANAIYLKTIDRSALEGRNVVNVSPDSSKFKAIFKSFLINTAMKYRHRTVSAYDIMQAYLTNSETKEFFEITEVDLLVIFLVRDPKNGYYGETISALLQAREMRGLKTWIFSKLDYKSQAFKAMYGDEIGTFIDTNNFLSLKV